MREFLGNIYMMQDESAPKVLSVPAIDGARVLLRQFEFVQKLQLRPTEKNIAVVIDTSTQVFRVGNLLNIIHTSVPWREAARIPAMMARLRWALRAAKYLKDQLNSYSEDDINLDLVERKNGYRIPSPCLHAARTLLLQYDIYERGNIEATEFNVAIIIDVAMKMHDIQDVMDRYFKTLSWWEIETEGAMPQEVAQEAFKALEILRKKLPNYGLQEGKISLNEKEEIAAKIASTQYDALGEISTQLSKAKTMSDQQRMLHEAGLLR